jgi:N-acetylneuraminate synthase/N,N'-diacetyllegionaminate synthase
MIVSTGMADLREIFTALDAVQAAGSRQLCLLHCVSAYPANPADVNLRAMTTMAEYFSVPVGFSDHTIGFEVPLAAVALGACIVEKHLTTDRSLPGPDHRASLEPQEFADMVRGIRIVEQSLGDGVKRPQAAEQDVTIAARKSLVAACVIPANTIVTPEMVAIKRPGTGLPPSQLDTVIGRRARGEISAGTPLTHDLLS